MFAILASIPLLLVSCLACSAIPASAQAPAKAPVPKISFRYQDGQDGQDGKRSAGKPAAAGNGASTQAVPPVLIVHVELQDDWHINSNAPLDSFLVPTTLEAKAEGLEFGQPLFPKPELQPSQVMGGDMALYTGAFDIRVPFASKAGTFVSSAPPRTPRHSQLSILQ